MGIDSHFLHRCTVERSEKVDSDAYNQDKKLWKQIGTTLPCRLVTKTQRIVSDDKTQLIAVTIYRLLVPGTADIQESDRIVDLMLEDDSNAGTFTVKSILPRRSRLVHHISLELEKVS